MERFKQLSQLPADLPTTLGRRLPRKGEGIKVALPTEVREYKRDGMVVHLRSNGRRLVTPLAQPAPTDADQQMLGRDLSAFRISCTHVGIDSIKMEFNEPGKAYGYMVYAPSNGEVQFFDGNGLRITASQSMKAQREAFSQDWNLDGTTRTEDVPKADPAAFIEHLKVGDPLPRGWKNDVYDDLRRGQRPAYISPSTTSICYGGRTPGYALCHPTEGTRYYNQAGQEVSEHEFMAASAEHFGWRFHDVVNWVPAPSPVQQRLPKPLPVRLGELTTFSAGVYDDLRRGQRFAVTEGRICGVVESSKCTAFGVVNPGITVLD